MRKEIKDVNDIRLLVDTFYERVAEDELLAPIFHGKIKDMPSHVSRMYRFWNAVLMEESSYDAVALSKHAELPLMNQHFVRWLSLFLDTLDDLYSGALAEFARVRAIKMAEEFQVKLELSRF